MEYPIVATWLRFDLTRWIAGVLSGLFAGALALIIGGTLASMNGLEFSFPAKLIGTLILGPEATSLNTVEGVLYGVPLFELLCGTFGLIFAHFVSAQKITSLLAMGLVWAAMSWIFIWNLFMQSFRTIYVSQVSSGAAFLVCLVYGLGLSSILFFDPLLRLNKKN